MVNFTILAKGVVALYYQLTDTSHASGITALLRAAYDEYLSIYVDASFQRITHSSGAAQARGGTPTGPPLGQMKEPSSHTHGASSDTRKSMSMVRVDDGRPLTDFERFRTRWHWVIAICKRPPLQIRLQGPTTAESDNRKGFAQLGRNHKAEDSHSRKSSVLSEDEGARTTPHLVRTCLRTLNAPVVIAVCALYCFPSVAAMDPGDTSAPHVRQTAGLNVTATAGLLAVAGFYSLMRDKVSLVFGSIMAGSATTWTVLSTSADVSLTWKFSMLAIFGVSTLGYVGCRTMQKAMSTPTLLAAGILTICTVGLTQLGQLGGLTFLPASVSFSLIGMDYFGQVGTRSIGDCGAMMVHWAHPTQRQPEDMELATHSVNPS